MAPSLVDQTDVSFYFEQTSREASWQSSLADYPPLSRPILMAPRLFATREDAYIRTFMLQMLLVDLLAVVIVSVQVARTAQAHEVPRRLCWYTAYVLALSPLIFTRFDLIPAVLAFTAAVFWNAQRRTGGAVIAALGVFIKLFPVCVALVGFIKELRDREATRLRGSLAFLLSLAVLTLLTWGLEGRAFVGSFVDRRLQLESTLAGIVMIIGKVAKVPMSPAASHGAIELAVRGARLLAALTLPLQAILVSLTLWRLWRSPSLDFLRAVGATILALIIPSKVLSPQYLIWLVPFVPAFTGSSGTRARWLFLAASLATIIVYPFRYFELGRLHWSAIGLLNLRNALLIALWIVLMPDVRGGRCPGGGGRRLAQESGT